MKPRRLFCWLAIAGLLFVLGLVAANLVDYVRFHRAVARAKGLTEDQWRALGDRCRAVERDEEFEGEQVPAEFQPLSPLRVNLYRRDSHAVLYECGKADVSIDVHTSPQNQRISLWAGSRSSATLWLRDPDLAQKLNPDRRLVTVSLYGIHSGQEWIVLENEIRVVDHEGASNLVDAVVESAPLARRDRDEIAGLLRAIGPEVRGKDWRLENVVDGFWLNVRFSQSGVRGPDDIELNNVWVDEIGPLIEAVSRCAPKDYPINYRQIIVGDSELHNFRCIVRSLKEVQALEWPPPRTPWWCVWRRFVR